MSDQLTRDTLWSLEEYAEKRQTFRAEVMAHKKNRRVELGEHVRLYFEDALTIRYQIQEMLRAERIFEAADIEEELAVYTPLIPDHLNLKATMMIEYDDVAERKRALAKMVGIEHQVWLQVADFEPVYAIADEDLERSTEEKTSAVHFMRFQFSKEMASALRSGATLSAGVDHTHYQASQEPLAENIVQSLRKDLQ